MLFGETPLAGAFLIDPELREDERGFFARAWCRRELAAHGLTAEIAQANLSFNHRRGTLRGMHFQRRPHEEVKLVRCVHGALFDVIVDLRPESPTYLQWLGVELTAKNRRTLYVPAGFAHGFQTLEDATEVFYLMSEFHTPEAEAGARWDDPAFGIIWPGAPERIISKKDQAWPPYQRSSVGARD